MSNEKDVVSFFPDGSLKVSDMACGIHRVCIWLTTRFSAK